MKILVIAPTPFFSDRGTHIRILEESLALERLGHEIVIATYHIGRDVNESIETKIDVRRIRRLLFWYKKLEAGPDWQKIILDIMLLRKVFYLARTQKPDVIHAHLHEGALIGWLVKKFLFWRKIVLVADFHGSLTKEMVSHGYLGAGFMKNFFRIVEKMIDNLGDFAITSSWENSELIKLTRKDGKIETVLDGVNLGYYKNLPSKNELRKELELPQDKIIFSYTGALIPNKGVGFLLEAIIAAVKATKNTYFIIGGFPAEEISKLIKSNNLSDRVRLIHPLNYFDLPEILAASDVGIDPKDSATGQASGKILQYMGAGLPVICFDRKNNHEYVGAGGYYSEKISAGGIAAGILYFSDKPEKIAELGQLNRDRAESFSWERSARAIENIYKKMV